VVDELPDGDADPEDEDGVEIEIEPRVEDLQALGVGMEEFEAALMAALDSDDRRIDLDDAARPFEETELILGGKTVRLGDVADVAVTGGFEHLEGDDEDEDDDDEADEPEDDEA
jgi:hypothetical protein